jgi:hypothetical protein
MVPEQPAKLRTTSATPAIHMTQGQVAAGLANIITRLYLISAQNIVCRRCLQRSVSGGLRCGQTPTVKTAGHPVVKVSAKLSS